ncbi:peptidoglycan-binding domain-containing protein [Calothrix rhizosoleniae]|uniref:peptidoglycan-binding domain-containing protein n=1 Tax=Calothrix rhizosoleniae TaxID=888997 RepID=UPI000B4A1ED1|nr:peptidoglycan-binding protein [Calothrix rhizosoleniae]
MTSSTKITNSISQLNQPILEQGSRGEAVKELQKLLLPHRVFVYLNQQGACVFPGEEVIDGIFGAKTKQAVILYQNIKFLVEDGIVDDRTWRSLYQGAPVDMPILKQGSKGELVEKIQARLAISGYYQGEVDGDFGPITETAVKNLQQQTGLVVDGIVGDRTWFELSTINTIFC